MHRRRFEGGGSGEGRRRRAKRGRCGVTDDGGQPALSVGEMFEILARAGVPWECYRAYAELKRRWSLYSLFVVVVAVVVMGDDARNPCPRARLKSENRSNCRATPLDKLGGDDGKPWWAAVLPSTAVDSFACASSKPRLFFQKAR